MLSIRPVVVSYRNSTSNHNVWLSKATHKRLYLIEILHQTTTGNIPFSTLGSCILSKFYIKPQLRLERELTRCVVSYRNSTSNHNGDFLGYMPRPVVSYRNSTSNHNIWLSKATHKRVVSYRNSTSNHNLEPEFVTLRSVVSYRNSTSNHNGVNATMSGGSVVSYRNSTSNHNRDIR